MRLDNFEKKKVPTWVPSFFQNFFTIFYSREYADFESTHLQFRKEIIKSFQISMTIVMLTYMALAFPFQTVSIYTYITLPSCLVINYLICQLLLTKKFEKYCVYYIILLQISGPMVGLELTYSALQINENVKALFMGIGVGLMFTVGFLNLSSPLHKFLASFLFFAQIIFRHFTPYFDKGISSLLAIGMMMIYVNFVYYRKELFDLKVWNSLIRSNQGLKNFEKLIEVFPNQLIIMDKNSLIKEKPLYSNKEAERLFEEMTGSSTSNLSDFLELFVLDETGNTNNFSQERVLSAWNLRQKVEGYINSSIRPNEFIVTTAFVKPHSNKYFSKIQNTLVNFENDDFKNDKWEIKLGWIDWSQKNAFIIIFNDISKTEKIRELKILDQNKDRMLATISHELKTPLNGIIGMVDASEQDLEQHPENVMRYLKVANESAQSLLHLINDIIDITNIRKGALRLNLEKKNLRELVEKITPIIEIHSEQKGLQFIFENNCPPNTVVNVDPVRFKQILMNLLGNAIKFTSEGFVRLSLNLKESPKVDNCQLFEKNVSSYENIISERDVLCDSREDIDFVKLYRVEISIEDSGIGIDEDKRENIFQMFGKCDKLPSSNEFKKGVGLGLAISQFLSKQMNSSGIDFKSQPGRGSIFFFEMDVLENELNRFYFRKVPDENKKLKTMPDFEDIIERIELSTEHSPTKKVNPFRLLVVEDDQVNQLVIDLYLKAISHKISSDKAYNGKEAIKLILDKSKEDLFYDLILMDIDMPVMNGLEATLEIKKLQRQKEIPEVAIIAVTANASMIDKEICLNHGMKDVWTKPITRAEFVEKLNGIITKKNKLTRMLK